MGLMDKLEERFIERFKQWCQFGRIAIEIKDGRVQMYIDGECFDVTKDIDNHS